VTDRLEATCRTFEALERQLADPSVTNNPQELLKLARERSRLEPLVLDYQALQVITKQNLQAREMLRESRGDAEMELLAQEEIESLDIDRQRLEEKLRLALLPSDPRDERSVMLEIRAGAGGDEFHDRARPAAARVRG